MKYLSDKTKQVAREYKSETIRESLNPVWNEEFQLYVFHLISPNRFYIHRLHHTLIILLFVIGFLFVFFLLFNLVLWMRKRAL